MEGLGEISRPIAIIKEYMLMIPMWRRALTLEAT